ncbi:MAG: SDR family oxidoreductase [Myxococcota bacterium]|jgi:enoyl-[acyl-carrier protein] reductase III|nr:SDR family oxidoreductase [Myxococcota bacterium]
MRSEKRALVTGGSRGIGRAIALRLAADGADVAVGYLRNQDAAEEVCAAIRALGRRAIALEGDLRDPATCKRLVGQAVTALGGLEVLVSNAAIGAHKEALSLRPAQWDLTLESSTRPLLLLAQAAAPHLAAGGGGSIVALSSLGSRRVVPGYAAMGCAKAAVEALVRYLAVELAPRGIRVNCVVGGLIRTDAVAYLQEGARMLADAAAHTPLGRVGEPEDLARVVAFLASAEASWITGQALVVDGGLSLR